MRIRLPGKEGEWEEDEENSHRGPWAHHNNYAIYKRVEPVSEEKRREEFRAKFYALFAKADNYRGLYMTDNLAFFLFDTFALKEKP